MAIDVKSGSTTYDPLPATHEQSLQMIVLGASSDISIAKFHALSCNP